MIRDSVGASSYSYRLELSTRVSFDICTRGGRKFRSMGMKGLTLELEILRKTNIIQSMTACKKSDNFFENFLFYG